MSAYRIPLVILLASPAVVSLPAAAQSPSPQEVAVIAGKEARLGYYSIFKKDCTVGPLPDIVVSGELNGGVIFIQDAMLETKKVPNCPLIKGHTRVVFYKAKEGFSGEDTVTIKVVNPITGAAEIHPMKITVKGQ